MVPRNSNHPWRIRLIVMVILAASVGLVEAIQASVTSRAGVRGEAMLDANHFNTGSSLNSVRLTVDSAGRAGRVTERR
jgi:hypothetical protein